MKRKREDCEEEELQARSPSGEERDAEGETKQRKAHRKGPKGPNPLAVKKSKKTTVGDGIKSSPNLVSGVLSGRSVEGRLIDGASVTGVKRKRRRKHKSGAGEGDNVTNRQENIGSLEE